MSKFSFSKVDAITFPRDNTSKLSNELSAFSDWWFAGVLVVIYWTGKNVFLWPDEIVEWLTEQQPKQRSAASKEDLYIELIVRKYPGEGEKEVYQFYIVGDEQLNWRDGAILDCNVKSFPVMSVIDFANQCDLLHICEGDPINTTGDEGNE